MCWLDRGGSGIPVLEPPSRNLSCRRPAISTCRCPSPNRKRDHGKRREGTGRESMKCALLWLRRKAEMKQTILQYRLSLVQDRRPSDSGAEVKQRSSYLQPRWHCTCQLQPQSLLFVHCCIIFISIIRYEILVPPAPSLITQRLLSILVPCEV